MVVDVLEPVAHCQKGQGAWWPSSSTFTAVKVASVKPAPGTRPALGDEYNARGASTGLTRPGVPPLLQRRLDVITDAFSSVRSVHAGHQEIVVGGVEVAD